MGNLRGVDLYSPAPSPPSWRPTCLTLAAAFPISFIALIAWQIHGCSHEHSRSFQDVSYDISPSGDRLIFGAHGDGGHDLYILDLATHRVTPIAQTPDYESDPTFTPDGQSIVYSSGAPGDRADHLFLRSLKSGATRQLTDDDANDSSARVSPDGQFIVFERALDYSWGGKAANWSNYVICTIRVDGTNLQQVSPSGLFLVQPRFRPDGGLVAWGLGGPFVSRPENRSSWDKLLDMQPQGVSPSPDGRLLAVAGGGPFASDVALWLVDVESRKTRKLCHPKDGCSAPAFSPDGRLVYFLATEWPNGFSGEPKENLWSVGINGQNARLIAPYSLFDSPLAGRPPASR